MCDVGSVYITLLVDYCMYSYGWLLACSYFVACISFVPGNHTSITGVPLLRLFWEPFIDLFGSVTSTFFHAFNNETNTNFYIAGHETSVILFDEYAPALRVNKGPFLDVIFEILLAFQRLFRSEMVSMCFCNRYITLQSTIHIHVRQFCTSEAG